MIVGIGNELSGDDAAGLAVVRALRKSLAEKPGLLLIEAGPAPENYTAPIRRFNPELILLIDAADLGEPPGQIFWLDWRQIDALSASTHSLPPSLFINYLTGELDCRVGFLGIQVQQLESGQPLSPPVLAAVEEIACFIKTIV